MDRQIDTISRQSRQHSQQHPELPNWSRQQAATGKDFCGRGKVGKHIVPQDAAILLPSPSLFCVTEAFMIRYYREVKCFLFRHCHDNGWVVAARKLHLPLHANEYFRLILYLCIPMTTSARDGKRL